MNVEKKRYSLKPSPRTKSTHIKYADELNTSQLEAVQATEGPHLVIAGAGTGKTRTLVYRVAYLIEQGVAPEEILLMTFTKKSAEEMMRRAAAMLDGRCKQIVGGTFHGFANSILRRYAGEIGYDTNFSIADRSDAEDIVQILRVEFGMTKAEKRFPKKRTLLSLYSKSSNTLRSIEEIVHEEYSQYIAEIPLIVELGTAYSQYKSTHNIMDYDDLLLNLKKLLEENDALRSRLSLQHRYCMIDEFQDTNFIQADIAHLLASEHGNIMAVGDDAQSIYSFRGANFRNIMDFPKRYTDCKIIRLEHNYRSTEPILQFSNALMLPATDKYEKQLYSKIPSTQKPVFLEARSFDEQANFIAQRVLELREEGVALNEIAVLFRSGWHSNELEFELSARNIPFVKYGGLKFAEAAHVKDLVSILRVLNNPSDTIAWSRLLLLIEGVGPKTAQTLSAKILAEGIDAISPDAIRGRRYADTLVVLYSLLARHQDRTQRPQVITEEAARFYQPLLKANYDDFKKRQNDIASFVHLAERYTSLAGFLDELSLHPPDMSQIGTEPEPQEKEKLVLSTIHSAKGLEWHSVFILCLIDGFLPAAQSLHTQADIEEERRLLYVACTRAKQNLCMLCPQLNRRGGTTAFSQGITFAQRSRFLSDMRDFEALVEQWVLT